MSIPESDWKKFKKLREVALDRYCEQILREVRNLSDRERSTNHERYLELYRYIDQSDDNIARMFNDPRRSTAIAQLLGMVGADLITEEELIAFSEDTRSTIEHLARRFRENTR
jgi:hypothetical protein